MNSSEFTISNVVFYDDQGRPLCDICKGVCRVEYFTQIDPATNIRIHIQQIVCNVKKKHIVNIGSRFVRQNLVCSVRKIEVPEIPKQKEKEPEMFRDIVHKRKNIIQGHQMKVG